MARIETDRDEASMSRMKVIRRLDLNDGLRCVMVAVQNSEDVPTFSEARTQRCVHGDGQSHGLGARWCVGVCRSAP